MPRTLTIPIASGSEPELIEIDDATEAIGMLDPDFAYFDEDAVPCEESPSGQCEFLRDNNVGRCLYCGRKSEL